MAGEPDGATAQGSVGGTLCTDEAMKTLDSASFKIEEGVKERKKKKMRGKKKEEDNSTETDLAMFCLKKIFEHQKYEVFYIVIYKILK